MEEHLIERIRGLCARLVEIAPWWAGCWTPVPDEQLQAFDRAHGVKLPSGYRRLLREIGDHAPVPGRPRGGLLGLEEALHWRCVDEWLGVLGEAFSGVDDEPIELEWDDATDAYCDPRPLRGCLPVLDGGCDLTYLLVVTGPDRGRVWSFTASGSPQLRPTGAEFLDWYVNELARAMASLEDQARDLDLLERQVAATPGNMAASVALGRALLLRDRPRARALLERAWADGSLDGDDRIELRRAIAELDLLDDRRDRIESMAEDDDDWLRTYAGIVASRAGDHEQTIARLEGATIPTLLRAAATGHLALAHAALGRIDRALELLRASQASGSNHAIAARLRTALGQRDTALRSWREALASRDRSSLGPRPPRLSDFVEPPLPDRDEIEAAIATLEDM